MTLENLLGVSLQAVEPDRASINRLLEEAARSLADAQLADMSSEGQLANAALQANGFRTLTSKPGHHQTMIQTLPRTVGLERPVMIVLDSLRKQRNVSDYEADPVSASLANEAVMQAQSLFAVTVTWLQQHKSHLMS
jgi:hypothetical protein